MRMRDGSEAATCVIFLYSIARSSNRGNRDRLIFAAVLGARILFQDPACG